MTRADPFAFSGLTQAAGTTTFATRPVGAHALGARRPVRRPGKHALPRRRRRWTPAAVLLLIAAMVPVLAASTREAQRPQGPTPPGVAQTRLWNSYGNAGGGHWTGGDCTSSVELPDGRIVWLFCDTFLGEVNADYSRPSSTPFIRNSMVVQDGKSLTTVHGGPSQWPLSLVGPTIAGVGTTTYWPADGTVEANSLQVFYTKMTQTGTEPLDNVPAGTLVASFSLPNLTLTGIHELPVASRVSWGMAIVEETLYTYVYGVEEVGDVKYLHVARARRGALVGAWEFYSGDGWSRLDADSVRLTSGVGHLFSIDRIAGRYLLVTQDTGTPFSPHIVAYSAESPTGPFGDQIRLYTVPDTPPGGRHIAYDARAHPELTHGGDRLVLSYNVNSLTPADVWADVRLYRPRFVDVAVPTARSDPRDKPPTGLTACAEDGHARLTWPRADRDTRYWLYQRRVSAGQTQPSRLGSSPSDATSVDVGTLTNGDKYEYQLTAVTPDGESRLSPAVLVVPGPPSVGAPSCADQAGGAARAPGG